MYNTADLLSLTFKRCRFLTYFSPICHGGKCFLESWIYCTEYVKDLGKKGNAKDPVRNQACLWGLLREFQLSFNQTMYYFTCFGSRLFCSQSEYRSMCQWLWQVFLFYFWGLFFFLREKNLIVKFQSVWLGFFIYLDLKSKALLPG